MLIFDEPTRGIDVGAKNEIYRLMRELADHGVGILMISSDMEEVIGVSDRVAVMHEGRIAGFLERKNSASRRSCRLPWGGRLDTIPETDGPRSWRSMINRKDLWLLVLILVVGTVVAIINPRFLSPINLSNTANLVGLFGIFAVAQAFVIISGGIELSVGSIIALLGVIFIDLVASGRRRPRPSPSCIVVLIGCLIGLLHGFLVAKVGLQPFVVTLVRPADLPRRSPATTPTTRRRAFPSAPASRRSNG